MPRTAVIAQADISRALRAFRKLGIEAEVRILPDGTVLISPVKSKMRMTDEPAVDSGHKARL